MAISGAWILDYLFPGIKGPVLYAFRGAPVHLGSLFVALGFILTLAWANYRGVDVASRFQDATTYIKLAIVIVFISAGMLGGELRNLQPLFQTDAAGSVWAGILAVLATTPWFYGGFNAIPQVLEEKSAETPLAAVGRVMLAAIALSAVFYFCVILAASMVVPWRSLVPMDLPTAAAFAAAFNSSFFANLVLCAGLLGTFTVGNACYLWGTRVLFALSRGRLIRGRFEMLHPAWGSPTRAVVFVGIGAVAAVFLGAARSCQSSTSAGIAWRWAIF